MYYLKRISVTFSILLITGLMLGTPGSFDRVLANGPHMQSQQVFAGSTGNYELRVLATMNAPIIHFSIYVSDAVTKKSVEAIDILVSGHGPSGSSAVLEHQRPVASIGNPGWFGLDVHTGDKLGEWKFVISLEGPTRADVAGFKLDVQRENGFNLFTWGAIAVFLSTFIIFIMMCRRRRGTKQE
ncbi:hypothetical protein FIM02_01720 [SAR202 cluster bacterium AD-802-E10_MRT_200m]|nr:hypothetical protein [SAR202 cluster bacterium AD-802-E10_MRT_200m]